MTQIISLAPANDNEGNAYLALRAKIRKARGLDTEVPPASREGERFFHGAEHGQIAAYYFENDEVLDQGDPLDDVAFAEWTRQQPEFD